jgi:hypothetical protein
MILRMSSQRALELLSRWRVDVAWIGVIMVVFTHPTTTSIAAFSPLVAAGLLLRLWARGHLERGVPITQTGPYAYVRHPLYVGSFVLGLGFALMSRSAVLVAIYVTCFLVMYLPKALREEAYLRDMGGLAYAQYMERTGAVLPRARRAGPPAPATRHFEWQRVRRHREWRTWVGVLVLLAIVWERAARYLPFP